MAPYPDPRNLKPAFAALAILASAWTNGSAADAETKALLDLEKSQTGVTLSGKASSRYQRAAVSGDSVKMGKPTIENAAFTQAEVDLIGRPSASTRGRLLFRIHQDWSNYYEEGPNPLTARWFDFNGELYEDRIRFAVGDYRAKHTPLTLNAPGPELLYEPEIFAEQRQTAMEEFFLGENRLPLQGLNLGYDQDFASSLGLHSDVAVARLRNVHSGSTSFFHWTDDVEKLALSSSWKAGFADAVTVGYSQTYVYDDIAASRARNNTNAQALRGLMPRPLYENNGVNSFSLDLDGKRWLKEGKLAVSLETEYAMSSYESQVDTANPATFEVTVRDVDNLKATALRSVFKASYGASSEGPFGLALRLGYLKNEKDFTSDLAQSPTFLGRRILNSRSDVGGPAGGYNTLDALYHHLYAVDPVTNISSSEQWYIDAKSYNGTNNWYRAPFLKNSYGFYTTTKSERDAMMASGALDPHVQLLFPFGPATPNRTGLTLDLNATLLSGAIETSVLYAGLKEVEGSDIDSLTATPADFARMGGGLKVNLEKFLGSESPVTVSGSYVKDSRTQAAFSSKGVAVAEEKFETAMINAGVRAHVYKGMSLLGGYQSIKSNPIIARTATATARSSQPGDLRQDQWSAGIEYKITHGAYVTAEYGRMGLEEAVTLTRFSQDISSLHLVIAY
jgi:hypothetical protein